jgi:hypothetical protein
LWGSTDILGVYIKQLEDLSQEVLDMHKEQKIVAAKATTVAAKATKGKSK